MCGSCDLFAEIYPRFSCSGFYMWKLDLDFSPKGWEKREVSVCLSFFLRESAWMMCCGFLGMELWPLRSKLSGNFGRLIWDVLVSEFSPFD